MANSQSIPQKNYKHSQYMNGYDEGCYNIVVTQYEPDDLQDYLSKNEVVYDKKEMNGKYQVGSGRIVTVTHDTPFIEYIVPQEEKTVKKQLKKDPDIRYQKKKPSNRSILANALEGAAQNDIERNKLAEYKQKISLIESEEQRLSEIQKQLFTKGGVDPAQRKDLQFEAKQIANRITTYDRQLLNLEAMASTELTHAMNIHEFAVQDIEELKKVYTPPVEMLEKWEHAHKVALEQVANIKQILSL